MPTPRRTRAALASVLWVVVGAAPARAADEPKPAPPAAAAPEPAAPETYQKVLSDFQTAQREFSTAYSAAKDDASRRKLVTEKYPNAQTYAKRFVALAKAAPGDPAAVDALVWVASQTQSGEAHDQALYLLSVRYVKSDRLSEACQRLAYSQSSSAAETLQAIADQNPHPDVKAHATFALGQYYKSHNKVAEAEKVFEEVAAKHASVASYRGTLGEAAKANLREIRDLTIGKVAPEIEGEDVEGKKFKLSEYRGKVVVLDFWGDW